MLAGKCILVTGATDGIGRHTAELFLKEKARVLIHGRSVEKVASTANHFGISQEDSFVCDLSSLESVRIFASQVRARVRQLDILLNNAGHFNPSSVSKTVKTNDQEIEETFVVNVLTPFLLTHLLFPLFVKGTHIINVSSISQSGAFNDDFLNKTETKLSKLSGHDCYSLSKLCCVMWSYLAAQKLNVKGIRVNTLDPGTVNTKMLLSGWGRCGIEIEDANDEFLMALEKEEVLGTGKYLVGRRETKTSAFSYDFQKQTGLWNKLIQLSGIQKEELLF